MLIFVLQKIISLAAQQVETYLRCQTQLTPLQHSTIFGCVQIHRAVVVVTAAASLVQAALVRLAHERVIGHSAANSFNDLQI